ncbi:rhodanese-like domain-containing protein [Tamlana haliotis]|uniref:Rhodanese-like domain-containing protein n=1 Tax=Pseudotamlana haliotis TaxID=2614804 RepID=A0A6N6MKR7_9FLAO|nr:rhodanese-like domain-containing protein [Tamlana haliotis]KAB1068855.1 rhodanese-like domain-containing protein [Tamlana haliotis]
MGILSSLFGNKKEKIKDFQSRDAIIIDVRTTSEYEQSAIPGSKNMPLQTLNANIENIKKLNKPVITCCASGVRSATAASLLKSHGVEALNGGGFMSLYKKLEL